MNFGVKTPTQHRDWEGIVEVWKQADEVEPFTSCWNFDHFYPFFGDSDGPCLESWVTLTALASATKRVRIGCMVTGTPYRHPALTANMAATLDIVSNGRLDLGVGAGVSELECDAYGFELLPLKARMDRFEESVQIIKSLLTLESTTFEGQYYRLKEARCEPKGVQPGGPPIVIGGGGEKRTLRIVAKYADHWNLAVSTPEQFVHKRAVLAEHCEAVNRNIDDIESSVQIFVGPNQDPSQIADLSGQLGDAGVQTILFNLHESVGANAIEPLGRAIEPMVSP